MKCAFKDGVKRDGCSAYYLNKILQHAFIDDSTQCLAAQSLLFIVQIYYDKQFSGVYLVFNSFVNVFYKLSTVVSDKQKKIVKI
jgi:hypothetical protein